MIKNDEIAKILPVKIQSFPGATFLIAGLLFLAVALILFLILGYLMYKVGTSGLIIEGDLQAIIGRLLGLFSAPLVMLVSAIICTFAGIKLLKAAGVVTQHIIPPHDYELLSSAIREGNEKAVSEYIRLSSLSGMTGTFTKIGLTGLPLATIVLTILLAILGLVESKFYDLAQLTLGAFIGSYVEKRQESSVTKQRSDNVR